MSYEAASTVQLNEYRCPSCGSVLQALAGKRRLICDNCHTPILVVYDDYVPNYFYKENIGYRGAIAKVRQALDNKLVDKKIVVSNNTSAHLWWVPVYRINGVVASEETLKNCTSYKITYSGYYNSALKKSPYGFENLKPGQFGWPSEQYTPLPVDLDELKKRGTILLPAVGDQDFTKMMKSQWRMMGLKKPELIDMQKSIVYIPFWVINLSVDGQIYSLVINGVDGSIFTGKVPARRRSCWSTVILASLAGWGMSFGYMMGQKVAPQFNSDTFMQVMALALLVLCLSFNNMINEAKSYYEVNWINGKIKETRKGSINLLTYTWESILYQYKRKYGKWD